jgi:SAM-dependent methyltransferase
MGADGGENRGHPRPPRGRLAPGRGERWLDVGTGAVALRAARAGARVTGVDLSPVMVDTARRLAREQGSGFRFDVGDAESLPYEDASFDVVASALGVFLAPDHAAAGRELAPACRAGGRLGVVAWRADPEAERMHAPFWPAREPGAGDRRDWGREEYLAELLGQDFELEFEEGELRLTTGSGEEMWRLYTSYDGAAKAQWTRSVVRERRSTAAPSSPITSATARTAASACGAVICSPWAGAGPAPPRPVV